MQTNQSLERIFHYQGNPLRTIQNEGEAWFIAADICATLGLSQVSRAVKRLDEDTVRLLKVTLPQNPARSVIMNAVNESGLYQLILASNKPAAKSFRRFVTHEVLPALRQTGSYQMEIAALEPGRLPRFSRRDLLNLAVEAETECEQLRQENDTLRPKAEYYDRVADTTDSFSLGETAKMLGIPRHGRNNLIKFLRRDGLLMANNVAKQRYIDRGYFQIVQHDFFAPDGTPRVSAVTRVYAKGVDFIRNRLDCFLSKLLTRQIQD